MRTIILGFALMFTAASASAQWGPRVGFSGDPDQIYGGAHWDLGDVFPNTRFQPSADVGFGDDVFRLAGNGAFHYVFHPTNTDWDPYVGGELSLMFLNFDNGKADNTDTELGLSLAVGIERTMESKQALSFELRLSLFDTPDVQVHVGWIF